MTLYLIGLGLDDKEVTEKGLDALENVEKAYAEFYTNTETVEIERLEEKTGTEIEKVSRKQVEQEDLILSSAKEQDTAFLVSGDAITATTHFEINDRAKKIGIDTEVIHGPSIFTSVAETGLSIYKFGRTVTLPENHTPQSVIDYIRENEKIGLHTLILLDINYNASEAAEHLIDQDNSLADEEFIVIQRANNNSQSIERGKLEEISNKNLGKTPHSLVKIGELSFNEKELLKEID